MVRRRLTCIGGGTSCHLLPESQEITALVRCGWRGSVCGALQFGKLPLELVDLVKELLRA